MKKYTLFSFVFILLLGLLGSSNVKSASAANCAPGELFSTTTGQSCGNPHEVVGCQAGFAFSTVTGQACSGATSTGSTGNSSVVAQFNALFKSNFKIGLRGSNDVTALQQFLKDQGYYFGKIDGSYGKITARAVSDFQIDNNLSNTTSTSTSTPVPCPSGTVAIGMTLSIPGSYICSPTPTAQSPVVSGVSGPQSLNVNQTGTWSVNASSSNGGNIKYAVVWGDEVGGLLNAVSGSPVLPQQSATFSHSYLQAGNYAPVFTITSSNGGSVQTSLSVNVGVAVPTPVACAYITPPTGYHYEGGQPYPACGAHLVANTTIGTVIVCEYPASPTGCSYTQGSQYNSTNNCGMILTCSTNPPIQLPTISYLSPTSGPVGAQVTIVGSGFGSSNTVSFDGVNVARNVSSLGSSISFTLQSYLYGPCLTGQSCMGNPTISPGAHQVTVSSNGQTSNTAIFTVTASNIPTVCEYAAPPVGYHYEGGQPYPTCGGHLVQDINNCSSNATCASVGTAVNGQCSSSSGQAFSYAPVVNLCSAGSVSSVSGSGPWSWTCSGQNNGSNAQCSATKSTTIVGTASGSSDPLQNPSVLPPCNGSGSGYACVYDSALNPVSSTGAVGPGWYILVENGSAISGSVALSYVFNGNYEKGYYFQPYSPSLYRIDGSHVIIKIPPANSQDSNSMGFQQVYNGQIGGALNLRLLDTATGGEPWDQGFMVNQPSIIRSGTIGTGGSTGGVSACDPLKNPSCLSLAACTLDGYSGNDPRLGTGYACVYDSALNPVASTGAVGPGWYVIVENGSAISGSVALSYAFNGSYERGYNFQPYSSSLYTIDGSHVIIKIPPANSQDSNSMGFQQVYNGQIGGALNLRLLDTATGGEPWDQGFMVNQPSTRF